MKKTKQIIDNINNLYTNWLTNYNNDFDYNKFKEIESEIKTFLNKLPVGTKIEFYGNTKYINQKYGKKENGWYNLEYSVPKNNMLDGLKYHKKIRLLNS